MADTINPVEALDKQWEQDQADLANQPEGKPTETQAEAAPTTTEQKKEEVKAEPKQDHAFKQLREEASRTKKEKDELAGKLGKLETLAKEYGFKNVDEFVAAWENETVEQKAKASNIDPKVARELNDAANKLSQKEQELTQKEYQIKVNDLASEIDTVAKGLDLTPEQIEEVINTMGQDGYDVNTLINLPKKSIGKVFRGYAADIVTEREVQKRMSSSKKNFVEQKVSTATSAGDEDPYSADSLKKEMEDYARKNKPWLYKK